MTTANKITIARILSIPFFVLLAVYYAETLTKGEPREWLRISAISLFILAAVSDGLDGYIARKYNQRSKLGRILDPTADKALVMTAIITLSVVSWGKGSFPIWFPVLVIARDIVVIVGAALVHYVTGSIEIKPSWLGKAATMLQMVAIGWVMLQLPGHLYVIWAAGICVLFSGVGYMIYGIKKLHLGGHGDAGS